MVKWSQAGYDSEKAQKISRYRLAPRYIIYKLWKMVVQSVLLIMADLKLCLGKDWRCPSLLLCCLICLLFFFFFFGVPSEPRTKYSHCDREWIFVLCLILLACLLHGICGTEIIRSWKEENLDSVNNGQKKTIFYLF